MTKLFTSEASVVTVVDPRDYPGWDRLVLSHPDFSFFHSVAWAKVLCRTYGHKPIYLRFSQGEQLAALIPLLEVRSCVTGRRGVSLPFCDFCDPLLFGRLDTAAVVSKLLELARERKWKYFELRGERTSTPSALPAAMFYGHRLDLRSGSEDLFARLKGSTRNAIRKAKRSGLKVRLTRSREAILEYYRLHVQTRKRHGLPPQPLSFFLNIYDEIIQPGMGFVVLAHRGTRAAAASVFFHMGKKAVYKFSASDEGLKHCQGNNLVMWKAIQFLAANGMEELHFGRTPLENQGLRRFKLAWGTTEETIRYFRFDTRANHWIAGLAGIPGLLRTISGRLPLSLNRLLGAVYPHLSTIAIALSPSGL
jgi:hypothetical protein